MSSKQPEPPKTWKEKIYATDPSTGKPGYYKEDRNKVRSFCKPDDPECKGLWELQGDQTHIEPLQAKELKGGPVSPQPVVIPGSQWEIEATAYLTENGWKAGERNWRGNIVWTDPVGQIGARGETKVGATLKVHPNSPLGQQGIKEEQVKQFHAFPNASPCETPEAVARQRSRDEAGDMSLGHVCNLREQHTLELLLKAFKGQPEEAKKFRDAWTAKVDALFAKAAEEEAKTKGKEKGKKAS